MTTLTCDTRILDSIIRQVSKGDRGARIGFFEDSGKHPRSGEDAHTIAAINNFGAPEQNIPERPFVTDGAVEVVLASRRELLKGIRELHKGHKNALRFRLTEAADTQKFSILQKWWEAPFFYASNAESTIESKGVDRALHETDWLGDQIDIKYD